MAVVSAVNAEQAPNPRGGNVVNTVDASSGSEVGVSARGTSSRVVRLNSGSSSNSATTVTGRSATTNVSRSATTRPTSTVARTASLPVSTSAGTVTGRSGTVLQMAPTTSANVSRSATNARAATNVVSGTHNTASTARAAASNSVAGVSRAAMSRATAVFSDVSAIGGGYAQCREAYATCMDQFCANMNDTYRRCICSARYDEFRNTEAAIDAAVNMLAQFEDNNLAAVGLSAEEVAAMYSATEGENAIKRDTSAASELLEGIDELLSGKTQASSSGSGSTSLGIMNIDFSANMDDIWNDSGSSLFGSSSGVDLTTLTGQELYNEASKQCLELITDSCENDAVLTMARSAYGIMVTQDCNVYEKNINSKKETLEQTVRTAEKYLREARLEEYKSHNSDDVNTCIANVRAAIQSDAACGANYKRCLDYTGAYINQSTGEAIYSPRLFQLSNLITLPGVDGSSDVLSVNREFDDFLDSRRMFAETALDTCRDISDTVWEEFKRQALIEIAQAQDEKIEEVKMSCVSTMTECYDTQTGALQDFDNTTAQYTGAISAYAARQMCADKVIACASLYGNTDNCKFDSNGQLISGNATGATANQVCGLTALLAFVDTVDTVRISEGCETAINNYLKDLCTPTSGTMGYPWNCRSITMDDLKSRATSFANTNCMASTTNADTTTMVNDAISELQSELQYMLYQQCETSGGYWIFADDTTYGNKDNNTAGATPWPTFYATVYGNRPTTFNNLDSKYTSWGVCAENTVQVRCEEYNSLYGDGTATYDSTRNQCTLSEQWYQQQCIQMLGGYYENGTCYAANPNQIRLNKISIRL